MSQILFPHKTYGPVLNLPVLILAEGVRINRLEQKTHLQVGTN